jgi:outer membrane protein TolC
LAEARIQKEQNQLEIERERNSIYHDVVEVFKELEIREKRLDTSKQYRELMEKRLNAEDEKYRLGIGSSEWLFTYQERLVSAQRAEIGAIIDYRILTAKLEKVLGISLKKKNLRFRDYKF